MKTIEVDAQISSCYEFPTGGASKFKPQQPACLVDCKVNAVALKIDPNVSL